MIFIRSGAYPRIRPVSISIQGGLAMPARLLACLLVVALLGSCTPEQSLSTSQPAPDPHQVAQAVLAACPDRPDSLQDLTASWDRDRLSSYLSAFYGLEQEDWQDCAVYTAAESALAFEISVFVLTPQADPQQVLEGLEAYRISRQGDFTGYAPDQAALAEGGLAVLSAGEGYAALLICPEPERAQDAFYAALDQAAPATASASSSLEDRFSGRIPYTDPGVDDMTVYDTSAILSAWRSGDPAGLSDYDRTIYDRAVGLLAQLLTADMSDYDKELAVYDWLISNVSYDQAHYSLFASASRDSYTPYNPLVEGKGVCLGFATTFQLLMDLAGVECITVVGAAFQSREDHAWNMVRLNGAWYCVDATWDQGSQVRSYFNVTSDYMAATDHQWDYAAIPEATAQDRGVPGA